MAIDIRQIKIIFDTNIPGKQLVTFTKSLLYNPELKDMTGIDEYPYFTMDTTFPFSYLNSLSYEKRVKFFFNKSEMMKTFKIQKSGLFKIEGTNESMPEILTQEEQKNKKKIEDEENTKKQKLIELKDEIAKLKVHKDEQQLQNLEKEYDELNASLEKKTSSQSMKDKEKEEAQKIENSIFQTKNGDENVLIMLRLLFPTKYPIVGNVFSSFNSVILKISDFTLSFTDFLPSFLRTKIIEGSALYSYVKIDGKVYTVAQAIWLNDIYNHKEYAELIEKFKKLKAWKDKATRKLNDEIAIKAKKFNDNYGTGFDSSDIQYIKSQKKDVSMETLTKITSDNYALGKLQLEYKTYNDTVDDFLKTIDTFQKSVNDNDVDSISDNAKNMVDTYKSVTKYGTIFFKTKEKFNKIIENVNRDLEDIRINEYIRDKYMSKPGVDLDYERDDQKYISKLKSNFKEYTDFTDNIKKFRAPNKESSNYQLQKTFNEFLESRETYKGLFNFFMNPYNIDINPFDNIKKKTIEKGEQRDTFKSAKANYHLRKNTGVTILTSAPENQPGYEIYVQLNVIAGELNDSNKSLVDCLYQSDSLGNKLEYLVNETLRNPWDINSNRLFFDITEGEVSKEIENKKKEEKSKDQSKDQSKDTSEEIKQGGKIKYNTNTRKLRGDIIKTHKKRFI